MRGCFVIIHPFRLKGRCDRILVREGGEQQLPIRVWGCETTMCMLDEIRAKRDEIYAIARRHKAEKLWVFGSCARREERPDSDVDLLVKFGEDAAFGAQVRLGDEFNSYFGRKVDVVSDRGLSPYIRRFVKKEAVAI